MSCLNNDQIIEDLYDEFYEQFTEEGWLPNVAKILALRYAWEKFYALPEPDFKECAWQIQKGVVTYLYYLD